MLSASPSRISPKKISVKWKLWASIGLTSLALHPCVDIMSLCSLPIVALLATSTAIKVRIVVQPPMFVTSYYLLHVMLSLLVLTQLVKAVKRLAAYIAGKRVEVGLVIVYSRLSLVHEYRVAASNKAITKN